MAAALLMATSTSPGFADGWDDILVDLATHTNKDGVKVVPTYVFGMKVSEALEKLSDPVDAHSLKAAPAAAKVLHAAYQISNGSFTVEPGEKTPNGMQRTVWRLFVADRDGRVVLNTYGSSSFGTALDTVIAVYDAPPKGKRKLIASNDDTAVAGGTGSASFVQFDVKKGARYAIQIGDKADGGDVLLTAFVFPKVGGLAVQPPDAYGGYDYSCKRSVGASGVCAPATYVVTNATGKRLTVTATSDVGPGVTLPAPFTLAPGAVALKSVTFSAAFGGATVEARSGAFNFTGTAEGETIAATAFPAHVAVHDNAAAAPQLQISAIPELGSGPTGQAFYRALVVKNVGGTPATGCYVAPGSSETLLQTAWIAYDPKTHETTSEPYAPFSVAPGKEIAIAVAARAFHDRLADPVFGRPYEIACASGPMFPSTARLDFSDAFDVSANVTPLVRAELTKATPAGGVLEVGSKGAVMQATFRNVGEVGGTLTVKLAERSPFAAGPKRYPLALCDGSVKDAACLRSKAVELSVKSKPGKSFTVKIAAKRPAEDPGFDPAQIGLTLVVSQPYSREFPAAVPVGGLTRALARQ